MSVTIGLQISPQHGEMKAMRAAWEEAEALGVDALYTADHFHAMILDEAQANRETKGDEYGKIATAQNFEATSIQAAMAVTTTRPKIGCIVHANSYRNPNLMADIARTIDHLSGGRFILGIGTGYLKQDYIEYGYPFGTQTSRAEDLARDVPIIKDRFKKLNPPPMGPLPLLIATMGEKIGMPLAAKYADIWHVYGPIDKIREKCEAMKGICEEVGRNYDDIEKITSYFPQMLGGQDADPGIYLKEGIRNIVLLTEGPKWDLGQLREILQWRDGLQ